MANFHYNFFGGPCVGPGAPLAGFPNPIALTPAQLINAQLRLGIYPGGWVADEINWRIYAFCIGCIAVAGGGGPAIPGVPPGVGVAVGAPVAGGAANLPVSPVGAGVDATEKGQIGYHMGTAVGGSILPFMATVGPLPATQWYSFHLSRAIINGGAFTLAGGAPDIVAFAVQPTGPGAATVHNWVVWENKGHCVNFGGFAAIAPALAQAQTLLNMTSIPGNPALGIVGGTPVAPPWVPNTHIASQVDTFFGNFRVQTIDPPTKSRKSITLSPRQSDAFFRAYYGFLIEAIKRRRTQRRYDGRLFQTAEYAKKIRIGLDDRIYRSLGKAGLSRAVAKATGQGYKNSKPETIYVDPTGISVEIPKSWRSGPNTKANSSIMKALHDLANKIRPGGSK